MSAPRHALRGIVPAIPSRAAPSRPVPSRAAGPSHSAVAPAAEGVARAVQPEPTLRRYVSTAVSLALLLLVAATAALVIVIPLAAGGTPLTVLTNSMAPRLPPGTLVVIRPVPITDIRIGDVVTYQINSGDPAVVSHRVIKRSASTSGSTTFITKGDNNAVADASPVTEVQIRGVVWYSFPWLGYVNNAVNGPARSWIAPTVAGALFVYGLFTIVTGIRTQRRKRREPARDGSIQND